MDQLLLAGQPCSEAEWNLTPNGLQWKVNKKKMNLRLRKVYKSAFFWVSKQKATKKELGLFRKFPFAGGLGSPSKGRSTPWSKQWRQKKQSSVQNKFNRYILTVLLLTFSLSSALWILTARKQNASGSSRDQRCGSPSTIQVPGK